MIDEILKKIEKSGEKYWICGPDTGEFLLEKICEIGAKRVLEIGTSVGYSALWMSKSGAEIFTVESHKERGDLAEENFKDFSNIRLVRGHAPEVLSEIPGEFDFVFFDATKYEHLAYFEAVYPRMRKGAVLVVDNISTHGEGKMMRKFLDMAKDHPGCKSEFKEIGNGLLVIEILGLNKEN
ncbi:class I SAM-dependent methyltransferase [Patescibacteria group bacterium]|nr:class I SAM-dependent methyltransferase [Patescibacteria group bacterium]